MIARPERVTTGLLLLPKPKLGLAPEARAERISTK
jgi:hypothetical protein